MFAELVIVAALTGHVSYDQSPCFAYDHCPVVRRVVTAPVRATKAAAKTAVQAAVRPVARVLSVWPARPAGNCATGQCGPRGGLFRR